jgi:ubiquinone/menaquinone biosynthesis C-methylase UbiE
MAVREADGWFLAACGRHRSRSSRVFPVTKVDDDEDEGSRHPGSTFVGGSSRDLSGLVAARQYDAMAASYAAHIEESPYNAYYERPATIALLGDVTGKRVLEVGCGAGLLTEWLVSNGAVVTAVDVSSQMVTLARKRVGDRARVVLADVAAPLTDVADGSVELVVASLVLHYVRDWMAVFREFRRTLTSDGAVVFSTHHPAMDWQRHSREDYFTVKQVTERWTVGGDQFDVSFWRRPLTDMTDAIASSGFQIEVLVEPPPGAELLERDPAAYHAIRTQPTFLFFRLRPGR